MTAVSTAAVIAVCDSTRSPCVVAVIMNSVPPSAPPTAHVVAELPDERVTVSVHAHVVDLVRRPRTQIRMQRETRAVIAPYSSAGHRRDKQRPVGQPAQPGRLLHVNHVGNVAAFRDRQDDVAVHIGDVEHAIVPTRTLEKRALTDKRRWHVAEA